MLSQEIIDSLIDSPDSKAACEQAIRDLESDIKRTRFMYENTIRIIERMVSRPEDAAKSRSEIEAELEKEVGEIEAEIQQIRDAVK